MKTALAVLAVFAVGCGPNLPLEPRAGDPCQQDEIGHTVCAEGEAITCWSEDDGVTLVWIPNPPISC